MDQPQRFSIGDQVVHPKRPEWGTGTVRQAQGIVHQSVRAQRLAIDFANRGRVVVNTAIAPLHTKGLEPEKAMSSTQTPHRSSGGWLDQLERSTGNGKPHELWDLPEPLTDPFATLEARLRATLDTYRFSTEPRSLIDWAVVQTGLDDPLSKYSRSELEHAFPRFARDRDQHLGSLIKQLKRKNDLETLRRVARETQLPAARSAIDKALR